MAVISFNSNSMGFTNNMAIFGEKFNKRIPIICIEYTKKAELS